MITFEELTKANKTIKSTDIGKGKAYAEVNQRIKAFRMLMPNGAIETELISWVDGVVVFRAVIKDEEGKVLGTGTAYEKEGSSFINKTSAIENCETSAVGRALAMCGLGIDLSIASYEEVANAKLNQEKNEKKDEKKEEPKAEEEEAREKAEEILTADREEMIKCVDAHYPIGSQNREMLLKCWGVSNIEEADDNKLRAVYNKYQGK